MSESDVGVSFAVTRQNAGSVLNGAAAAALGGCRRRERTGLNGLGREHRPVRQRHLTERLARERCCGQDDDVPDPSSASAANTPMSDLVLMPGLYL